MPTEIKKSKIRKFIKVFSENQNPENYMMKLGKYSSRLVCSTNGVWLLPFFSSGRWRQNVLTVYHRSRLT